MRYIGAVCFALILFAPAAAQKHPVRQPSQFEIGRHTFFDFGPPFDFYELFIVRPTADGSSVFRILLTPPGNACSAPAKVETSSASLSESISALLGKTNPCSIPEKELRRELKRCRRCMRFSGANVAMHVPCGAKSRIIRSDILDRDMFDAAPNTPEHTSWTMQLLKRLDQALGPGVMEKPAFALAGNERPSKVDLDSTIEQELSSGAYDELFPRETQKPSELYRAAQIYHPPPTTRLLSSVPFSPLEFVHPEYPLLARAAHVEGNVSFTLEVNANGDPTTPTFEVGNPLLREAVKQAVSRWQFPKEATSQQIRAVIEFAMSCAGPSR